MSLTIGENNDLAFRIAFDGKAGGHSINFAGKRHFQFKLQVIFKL